MRNLHVWHAGSWSIFVRFCSGKRQCLSQVVYFNISTGNFGPNYPLLNGQSSSFWIFPFFLKLFLVWNEIRMPEFSDYKYIQHLIISSEIGGIFAISLCMHCTIYRKNYHCVNEHFSKSSYSRRFLIIQNIVRLAREFFNSISGKCSFKGEIFTLWKRILV